MAKAASGEHGVETSAVIAFDHNFSVLADRMSSALERREEGRFMRREGFEDLKGRKGHSSLGYRHAVVCSTGGPDTKGL